MIFLSVTDLLCILSFRQFTERKSPRAPSREVVYSETHQTWLLYQTIHWCSIRKFPEFLVQSNEAVPPCPICEGSLTYRDSVPRIRRKEGGTVEHLIIRRLRCTGCGTLHRELPDCLVPFKHYETQVIAGVLDGIVTPDDVDSEDYPCLETIRCWLAWFAGNLANIEGAMRCASSGIRIAGNGVLLSGRSLLEAIRNRYQDWLEKVLRIIYNSGGRIPSLRLH